jgi:hypothetical protein
MLNSEVVILPIDRPYAEVYAFCIDPLNFGRWNSMPGSQMEPLGGYEYLVDLPQGRRVMKFMRPNSFGILDYEVYERGETSGPVRPIRLLANGAGTDLQLTWYQQPGVSDEQFQSELEWLRSDLLRLKTFLETEAFG